MFKFTRQYPVFGGINNDQWNWLCDNIGKPQKDWTCSRGAVWFKREQDKMWYLLRWS